jgi:lambda family phage portal protein
MNWLPKFLRKKQPKHRGYGELMNAKRLLGDWQVSYNSEDADVWTNIYALTARVQDLFRTNPYYIAYRDSLWANVLGADGIMLRSCVKEREDRVIYTPEEKAAIRAHEKRMNRIREYVANKEGREFDPLVLLRDFGTNGSRVAQVQIGEPDVYARKVIESAWKEWQQKEFCDVRGTRNYQTLRQLRLISAVRDGDIFIRMVRGKAVNKFGFSLQLVNAMWCDHSLNFKLDNGNEVRMGIEYQWQPWGLGQPVAYYFLKRFPTDWQFATPNGLFGVGAYNQGRHDRIPASEILHYSRAIDADGTRPAPWVAATIPMARHLNEYQFSEVVAARIHASRLGWLVSDVIPEGGFPAEAPDPSQAGQIEIQQGIGYKGLPWGVKVQESSPTHPSGNYPDFRQEGVRTLCASMPGSDYSTMANDYAAINFSAGRLQRLDSQEKLKLIQCFDIDYAERPIFLAWLEMALVTKAIPLPLVKFDKFKDADFIARTWRGVDEVKEAQAAALRIANKISSRTRENATIGQDFEDILTELAEEQMLIETYGLKPETTVENPAPVAPEGDGETNTAGDAGPGNQGASKQKKKAAKTKTAPADFQHARS